MSTFKVGDTVATRIQTRGVIAAINGSFYKLDDGSEWFNTSLQIVSESGAPSVFTRETIVVSFGPDDEHELTQAEAYALLRALDKALDA